MCIRGREPDKKKPPEMSYGEALIASLRKTLADSEAEEQDTLPATLPTIQQPTSKSTFLRQGAKKILISDEGLFLGERWNINQLC